VDTIGAGITTSAAQRSKHASTAAHFALAADDDYPADQQVQQLPLAPITAAVDELEAAAALVDLEQVVDVVGTGMSGLVFSYR
jgi:hypothetical protein